MLMQARKKETSSVSTFTYQILHSKQLLKKTTRGNIKQFRFSSSFKLKFSKSLLGNHHVYKVASMKIEELSLSVLKGRLTEMSHFTYKA